MELKLPDAFPEALKVLVSTGEAFIVKGGRGASYFLLRGRCRVCGAPIGRFHLWIELAAIAVALWAVLEAGDDVPRLLASCVLGWMLLTNGPRAAFRFRSGPM